MASEIQTVMLSPDLALDRSAGGAQAINGSDQGAVRRSGLQSDSSQNGKDGNGGSGVASQQEVAKAVADINDHLGQLRRDLQFSIDDTSGTTVVKVVDAETDEVIRQIPAEDVLELRKRLEEAEGVIFRGEA